MTKMLGSINQISTDGSELVLKRSKLIFSHQRLMVLRENPFRCAFSFRLKVFYHCATQCREEA